MSLATYLLPSPQGPVPNYGGEALAFGNNVFVAVGRNGAVASSSDGVTWTSRNSEVAYDLYAVAYGNETFVAVGLANFSGSQITTSPDGINWTSRGSGYNNGFVSIAYGDYGFMAPNSKVPPSYAVNGVSTSPDGITWINRPIESSPGSVAFGQGTYVFVRDPGLIRQSTPAQARAQPLLEGALSSNGFQISVTAEPRYKYTLQSSPTLESPVWTNIYTFTGTQAVTSFLDSTASTRFGRFYRITSP